jgi:hypothetical protein
MAVGTPISPGQARGGSPSWEVIHGRPRAAHLDLPVLRPNLTDCRRLLNQHTVCALPEFRCRKPNIVARANFVAKPHCAWAYLRTRRTTRWAEEMSTPLRCSTLTAKVPSRQEKIGQVRMLHIEIGHFLWCHHFRRRLRSTKSLSHS